MLIIIENNINKLFTLVTYIFLNITRDVKSFSVYKRLFTTAEIVSVLKNIYKNKTYLLLNVHNIMKSQLKASKNHLGVPQMPLGDDHIFSTF